MVYTLPQTPPTTPARDPRLDSNTLDTHPSNYLSRLSFFECKARRFGGIPFWSATPDIRRPQDPEPAYGRNERPSFRRIAGGNRSKPGASRLAMGPDLVDFPKKGNSPARGNDIRRFGATQGTLAAAVDLDPSHIRERDNPTPRPEGSSPVPPSVVSSTPFPPLSSFTDSSLPKRPSPQGLPSPICMSPCLPHNSTLTWNIRGLNMTKFTVAYVNRSRYETPKEVAATSRLGGLGFSFVCQSMFGTLDLKYERKWGGPEIWEALLRAHGWSLRDVIMVYEAVPLKPESVTDPFFKGWSQDQLPRLYHEKRVLLFNWGDDCYYTIWTLTS